MNASPNKPPVSPAHSYVVELCFTGDGLEPAEITRRLGLQPRDAPADLNLSSSRRRRRPFWAYNGHCEDGFQREWSSLETGLSFLLRHLVARRTVVIDLSKSFEGLWRCGHFQASFDGGPTLSAGVLAAIASFGLPLSIDNYFSDEP